MSVRHQFWVITAYHKPFTLSLLCLRMERTKKLLYLHKTFLFSIFFKPVLFTELFENIFRLTFPPAFGVHTYTITMPLAQNINSYWLFQWVFNSCLTFIIIDLCNIRSPSFPVVKDLVMPSIYLGSNTCTPQNR